MTDQQRPRVLMVALDAMESGWLSDLIARGRLPNICAFTDAAHRSDVTSDGLTIHGSIWSTFASGTGPGTHGRYWWIQWLAEEMRYVRNSHEAFGFRPFWATLAEAGIKSTIVDLPYTPTVDHSNVRQAVGWGMHDEVEEASWPNDFLGSIRKRFGNHPLSFDTVEPQSARDKLTMVRTLRRGVGMRAQLVEWLAREGRDDLSIVVFSETHKAGHYLARAEEIAPGRTNVDLVGEVLEPLDAAWPAILDAAGPGTHVVLFGLHGMHHQVDYGSLGAQLMALTLGRPAEVGVARPDLLRRLRNAIPDPVHRAIWQRLPARVRAARQGQLDTATTDVANDPLIRVAHDGHFALRMNLIGRERDGIIGEEAGEAAIARLAELARGFKADNGLVAFEGVWRSSERAPGPRSHRLPDAMLLSNPEVPGTRGIVDGSGTRLINAREESRNGVHTSLGFCYFRPATGAGATPASAFNNMDFAPGLLSLFSVPAPNELQGSSFLR
ncbi:MAG: alkaline phosphatase family protein [Dehalococcoidia bacterium]|nr:alkaline phosphatase family protein [Dehalococcoidia bacterium]